MRRFPNRVVGANRAIWAAMAGHPFVVQERRVVAALRVHRLPSRPDDLLADLDLGLVLEAEAFTQTAAEHGVAADAKPWPVWGMCWSGQAWPG